MKALIRSSFGKAGSGELGTRGTKSTPKVFSFCKGFALQASLRPG